MRARKALLVAIVAVDVEPAHAVHAFQLLESVQRHLGRARHELEQLGPLFLVKRPDRAPEPLDLLRRRRVVLVLRITLPVVHVDVGQARNQQLELLLIEDGDQVRRDNVMEPYTPRVSIINNPNLPPPVPSLAYP